jgi:hypothetical protein
VVKLALGPSLPLLPCSVVMVDDEPPLLPVAAPALDELPRASPARTAPPITIRLSRFNIMVAPCRGRDIPGYHCHDGRDPCERCETILKICKEQSSMESVAPHGAESTTAMDQRQTSRATAPSRQKTNWRDSESNRGRHDLPKAVRTAG